MATTTDESEIRTALPYSGVIVWSPFVSPTSKFATSVQTYGPCASTVGAIGTNVPNTDNVSNAMRVIPVNFDMIAAPGFSTETRREKSPRRPGGNRRGTSPQPDPTTRTGSR